MKQKIIFKIRWLKIAGGIEKLTLDILNNLEMANTEIVLLVENREKDKNFIKKLKKNVEIIYLKPKWYEKLVKKIEENNFFFSKKLIFKNIKNV